MLHIFISVKNCSEKFFPHISSLSDLANTTKFVLPKNDVTTIFECSTNTVGILVNAYLESIFPIKTPTIEITIKGDWITQDMISPDVSKIAARISILAETFLVMSDPDHYDGKDVLVAISVGNHHFKYVNLVQVNEF